MKRSRWICIGKIFDRHFVRIVNCGFPGGFFMDWRGRVDWCQPFEFITFGQLVRHVRMRLKMARLELVAIASGLPRTWPMALLVLVRRMRTR